MGVRENLATGELEIVVNTIKKEPTLFTDKTAEILDGGYYYIYPIEAFTDFKQKCQFCKKSKFIPCRTASAANKCR